ncbi:stalk domain-containing protein [Cohnella sp.]|uniref:stalk domain-containing protein n=1 Tax=Cohnella sp. TaxID=1883426 RepID=UPI003568A609
MLALSAPLSAVWVAVPVAHAAAQAPTYKLVLKSETVVTSGARHKSYAWVSSDARESTEMMHVIQIDLNNPYVQLNALGGQKGSVTFGQSVTAMAKGTGAVAGINADVFGTSNEGAPIGAQITSGQLLVSTSQLKGMYAFAVTKDRKPMIDEFTFNGTVTVGQGVATFPLAGVNKSTYRTEPDNGYSHVDKLYMYTSAWTAPDRPKGSGTTPTEALVVDGIVTEISNGKPLATTVIPANGYILRGHRLAADFIINKLRVGDTVQAHYELQSLTNGKTYDQSQFEMMVGGHTLLVENGKAAAFSRNINGVSGSADRARTAVGYSKDGSTVYLITVEENGGRDGVSLKDMQLMMTDLGVWKGVNLDGGGSTTMVSRPLGDFSVRLTHPTFYGTTQRQVSNGIGVFTTAPAGSIKGIVASGPQTLFIGQETNYSLKAYDTYYNPIDPNGLKPSWKLSSSIGAFNEGKFTAAKTGKTTLTVTAGQASADIAVEVIGQEQIERLTIEPGSTVLKPGSTISVPVKARLKDGRELSVPASAIKWEFSGITAAVSGGKLTVNTVKEGVAAGYAIARYDGFGTVAVLSSGTEKSLENFENVAYDIGFTGLPAQTFGTAAIVTGIPERESSKALNLAYDFTVGSGSRFAYAVLNGGAGIALDGAPTSMTMDVLGDNSMNWLRAEFIDADGKQKFVTIARMIDWSGWKTVRVDLAASNIKGPARLTKLYVVNLEEDQDERELQGEIAIDDITLQYPPAPITIKKPNIVMNIGKTQAKVDGAAVKLPAAPFMKDGVTYLPLRFVAEVMGGQIDWSNPEKRVRVLRGDTMLELWVDGKDMSLNGVRQPMTSAPILKNGSVYVPVRIISEQLGQKVDWASADKTITIH